MNKNLITICARGGSKGVPNKNIRQLAGKHLIGWSIEHGFQLANEIGGQVVLSTDSKEILKIAAQYGLYTEYIRPPGLAGDNAGKVSVIRDLWEYHARKTGYPFDLVIDLDVSSPLRTINDLKMAYRQILDNEDAINLFSVSKGRKNPYFNMVEPDGNGFIQLSKPRSNPFFSRQSSPVVYEINGSFYFYKKEFFQQGFTSAVIDHKSIAFVMDHICFDIDSELDFEFLEYLVDTGKAQLHE